MAITRQELEEIIKTECEISEITPLVGRQISRFRLEHGLTYKQIARAVVYMFQIRKQKFDNMYGIGSVPNVVEQSEKYFNRLRREKEAQLKSLENKEEASNIILKPKMIKRKKISFTKETEE